LTRRIGTTSLYNPETRQSRVWLRDGDWSRILTPEDARQLAQDLLVVAEAADQDAFLVEWLRGAIQFPMTTVTLVLAEYRKTREQWQTARKESHDGRTESPASEK